MKVALFVDGSFLPSREGATQRIYLSARYLPSAGVEAVVFHSHRGWSDPELIRREDFTTYLLPPQVYYGCDGFLAALLRRENVDFVQMCDPQLILSQGAGIHARTGIPLVWEVHEVVSDLLSQLGHRQAAARARTIEEIAARHCDAIICFTEHDQRILIGLGSPPECTHISPCGIDLAARQFSGPNLDGAVVVWSIAQPMIWDNGSQWSNNFAQGCPPRKPGSVSSTSTARSLSSAPAGWK